jgi:uncharacterized protein YbjT (DUF2867 family)
MPGALAAGAPGRQNGRVDGLPEQTMRVLVVGATGVLGRETVRCLRAQGHEVRGMTRDAARAGDLAARGVEAVIGDLVDPASLDCACEGVDVVFAAAHGALGRGKYRSEAVDDAGHCALIDAARRAGATRFVYTSALGAAPDHAVDFLRTKFAIERYLAQSGLPHVVLRPSAFMEWHVHTFNGKSLLEKGRVIILGSGTKKRNFVAARDVAAVAAVALTGPMPAERIITIAGPGDFSNDEVASTYARLAQVPLRIGHVPRAMLSALGAVARPLHPGVARIMRIASLSDDAFPEIVDGAVDVVGTTTLEAFVHERVLENRAMKSGRTAR